MSADPVGCFSRTLAAWAFPSGLDLGQHVGRNLTITEIDATTLDGISAGLFDATGDHALLTGPPSFLNIPDASFEMLISVSAMPVGRNNYRILRIGDPVAESDVSLDFRVRNLEPLQDTFGFAISRRQGTRTVFTNVSDSSPIIIDATYHLVFVIPNANHSLIYINGDLAPLDQLEIGVPPPAPPLPAGPIPVPSTYELAIGKPSPTIRLGLLGSLGRVIVYPYAMTPSQIAASYRLQFDQPRVVGLGAATPSGATNRGPVAVPFFSPEVEAGQTILLPVATRSFDANADPLTAIPTPKLPDRGTSQIVSNQVEYRPNTSEGGGKPHEVPYRIRDASLLSSDSIVRVPVTVASGTEYPITLNNFFVANRADLNSRLSSSGLNTTIWLEDGDYGTGDLTINKAGSSTQPFLVRARNILGPKFNFSVNLNGVANMLVGVDFSTAGTTNSNRVIINNNRARVSRCKFKKSTAGNAASIQVPQGLLNLVIDYNEIDNSISNASPPNNPSPGIFIRINTDNTNCNFRIYRNYLHDMTVGNSASGAIVLNDEDGSLDHRPNGGRPKSNTRTGIIISHNLIVDWKGTAETITMKCCDVTIRRNTLTRSNQIAVRHGNNHMIRENYLISSIISLTDGGIAATRFTTGRNSAIGNFLTGSGARIEVDGGNCTPEEWDDGINGDEVGESPPGDPDNPPNGTNTTVPHPASWNALVAGNTGATEVGGGSYRRRPRVATNNRFEGNTPINPVPDNDPGHTGTTVAATTNEPFVLPSRALTAGPTGDCGPLAPYVPPDF